MPPTRPAIPPGRTGRRGCSARRSWAGVYQIGGMLAEPERGGQAGTFDAEHVDQTGDAMDLGALADEIIGLAALFRARRRPFRADAGIARLARPVRRSWEK